MASGFLALSLALLLVPSCTQSCLPFCDDSETTLSGLTLETATRHSYSQHLRIRIKFIEYLGVLRLFAGPILSLLSRNRFWKVEPNPSPGSMLTLQPGDRGKRGCRNRHIVWDSQLDDSQMVRNWDTKFRPGSFSHRLMILIGDVSDLRLGGDWDRPTY